VLSTSAEVDSRQFRASMFSMYRILVALLRMHQSAREWRDSKMRGFQGTRNLYSSPVGARGFYVPFGKRTLRGN